MKQIVDDATATIQNLKETAKPLIETNLIILAEKNRLSDGDYLGKNHDLYDQLTSLQDKLKIKDEDIEKAKLKYLNINAWDILQHLTHNIEKAGNSNFSLTVSKSIGRHTYDYPPDFNKYLKLLVPIELDDECRKQLEIVKTFYKKYLPSD